jgi:hypothetical protein
MGNCSFLNATEARNLARNNSLIWSEICGIQHAILAAIDNYQYDTVVNDGTPMTQVNEIQSVNVTFGGSNYLPVTATASIAHPTGSLAALTPVVTAGVVTGFIITNGGSGYTPVPAMVSGIAGGSAGSLQPVVTDGAITDMIILNPGTGYSTGNVIGLNHPYGTGASITVGAVGVGGEILSVVIANGGQDYDTVYATVEIDHPTGVGFQGTVQVNNSGVVTGVSIQNGGIQYQPLYPTATVTDDTGYGAVLTIDSTNVTGGVIQSITVAAGGYGYSSTPTITVTAAPTSSGSGATATAVVDANSYGYVSPQYYSVLSGQSSDRVITDQIQFVIDYFTALKYNIRAQVNPATGNTMQWYIIW